MVGAIRSAVGSLRRLMVDIYPPDLSGPGLATALKDLAAQASDTDVTVEVEEDELSDLPSELAALLYRTAKEALQNANKHAHARTVTITVDSIDCDNGSPGVRLCVADDGVGFRTPPGVTDLPVADPSTGEGHLGLRLVHDRVAEAGGILKVGNRPGGGAVLEVLVPFDRTD
jgi:signal transduction histidine kinase